jgi:hypothetical protein
MIWNQFLVKMYLYLTRSVQLGIQNTNFKAINQHTNEMCYVYSLEKDFYLGTLGSFCYVFTQVCFIILKFQECFITYIWGIMYMIDWTKF